MVTVQGDEAKKWNPQAMSNKLAWELRSADAAHFVLPQTVMAIDTASIPVVKVQCASTEM